MSEPKSRDCPDCSVSMEREDRAYVYYYTCENDDCGNADGFWRIYDFGIFAEVKHVQSEVGQAAAERVASEYDDGVLA